MLIISSVPEEFQETLSWISQVLSTQAVQVFPVLNANRHQYLFNGLNCMKSTGALSDRSLQMWSQVNKLAGFSHPSCFSQLVFSQSTIVWGALIYSPELSKGRLTSSPPLNTFEHVFLRTAGPCPAWQPDHPLLLVDQTQRARRSLLRQDGIPLKHTTQRNFNAKAGGGGTTHISRQNYKFLTN